MAKATLFDAYGVEITAASKRLPDRQAEIGRTRDRWSGRNTGEIGPERLAAAMKTTARVEDVMLLASRMLDDDHVFSCMRNLALSISRMPWEVLPFDESKEAEDDAQQVRENFYGFRPMKKFVRYLVFGEYYPFVGAANHWNTDYKLESFGNVDPWRWTWNDERNQARLLTLAQPQQGEELQRRGFTIHSSYLEPGPVRRRGLWRKIAWLWLFKNFTWSAWVRFAEAFGNPYILAFFERPEDKESVLEAVVEMDANARGVFPAGTEVKLQEAQRYGTTALYDAIKRAAEEGMTKVILGHVLNTDAKSGSGTLAGNAAADVSQANKEGVAEGIAETIQEYVVTPFCEWHFGEEQVAKGEIPAFTIKAQPPEDEEKKAKVFVTVNEALRSAGRAIDPEQIEDQFGVRTIAVGSAAEPDKELQYEKAKSRRATAKAPRLSSPEEVAAVTRQLVAKAVEEMGDVLMKRLEAASSIEEFADTIWEAYEELDPTKLASALRDATVTANLIGRGDADR